MISRFIGKLTFWKLLFVAIVILGAVVTFNRFYYGLGASTNLSDQFPWGIWIGFDLLVGVGLAAGGFVIAATVHLFGIEKYKHVGHPAILTAFLGYLLVIVALLFDLGQPWRIWHATIMWNPHSVMFEVAWCVMLYTTVLALEFSPMVFERFGWKLPLKVVRFIYVPLVVLGVLLSTMHQSSLGTLYVIAPTKLYGLWYSSLLPVFFFTSAIAGGLAMTIFESYMSYRAFGKKLENEQLRGLARVAVVVLAVYLTMRVYDLLAHGSWVLAFQYSREAVLFWGEIGLGVILPMILFAMRKIRHSQQGLFLAAMLTIMGFVINRLNVSITGMQAASGVNYFPSWMEITLTMTIVAVGFFAFSMAVKHLHIFPPAELEEAKKNPRTKPAFSGTVLIVLWVLLFVGAALVSFSISGGADQAVAADGTGADAQIKAVADSELTYPDAYEFPQGDTSPGQVTFNHDSHIDFDAPSCGGCHQRLFSSYRSGVPLTGELTYARIHEGDLCYSCHSGETAFSTQDQESCEYCHQ